MKALFFGTPALSVPYLRELSRHCEVVGVVSQPDKPAGRGLEVAPTPVRAEAEKLSLRVFQPIRPSEIAAELKALGADLGVVVAYGKILKPDVLASTRLGLLNVHFSLLPKYRGAAPVQWSLVRGEKTSGVTLFWLDPGMDTGPILLQKETPVGPDEDAAGLLSRLGELGISALKEALGELEAGKVRREPQTGEPSLAPLIKPEDARISLDRTAHGIHNLARGMRIWPKAYLPLKDGQRLIILKTRLFDGPWKAGGRPGTIIAIDKTKGFLVECSRSCIWFVDVQSAGKKPTPAAEYLNGLRLGVGDLLPL